jgi:hypothetical protein
MDEIKIPVQYGSNYELAKSIILEAGIAAVEYVQSKEKWKTLQSKYRLEDAQTEPMFSLIANDNWAEYTLRYVVGYKKRRLTKQNCLLKSLVRLKQQKEK